MVVIWDESESLHSIIFFFLFLLNTLFVIVSKTLIWSLNCTQFLEWQKIYKQKKNQQPRTENYMSIYANVWLC